MAAIPAELLQLDGVSRTVLEARVRALATAVDDLERRIEGRVDQACRTLAVTGESGTGDVVTELVLEHRRLAYETALADLRELVAAAIEHELR
jgi:hypothetical protein